MIEIPDKKYQGLKTRLKELESAFARGKQAEEALQSANQQLRASEQQLKAANQQLNASNQQYCYQCQPGHAGKRRDHGVGRKHHR